MSSQEVHGGEKGSMSAMKSKGVWLVGGKGGGRGVPGEKQTPRGWVLVVVWSFTHFLGKIGRTKGCWGTFPQKKTPFFVNIQYSHVRLFQNHNFS